MFKQAITIMGVFGALVAAQPTSVPAQEVVAQALVCLDVNEGRAIQERTAALQLQQLLELVGARGQLVSAEFCRAPNGILVWVVTERNGGAIIRRVLNAETGEIVPGL